MNNNSNGTSGRTVLNNFCISFNRFIKIYHITYKIRLSKFIKNFVDLLKENFFDVPLRLLFIRFYGICCIGIVSLL